MLYLLRCFFGLQGDLEQAKSNHFDQVPAIETVVHAGEVLYIPAFWFRK